MSSAIDEYLITPDPAPATLGVITPERSRVALKAFFQIANLWSLDAEETRILLGQPHRSTLFRWKKGDVSKSVSHDTVQRISYILGIYKALQILFKSTAQADGWVKRPNDAFAGKSALDRMLGGDVTDLAAVRAYLDVARGQGA